MSPSFCKKSHAQRLLSCFTIAAVGLGAWEVGQNAHAFVVGFEFDPPRLASVADAAAADPNNHQHDHQWFNLGEHAIGETDPNVIRIHTWYDPLTQMNADFTAGASVIRLVPNGGAIYVPFGSDPNFVSPFGEGVSIGPGLETRPGNTPLSAPYEENGFFLNGGQFGSGYIGFSFLREGNDYYGWIGLETNAPGKPIAEALITKWAFETSPNTPIQTGDTGGSVDPTAGDFDGDGDVDGRDFLAWQRDPDIGNLADWQNNYGTPSLSAFKAVPEPSSLALLMMGAGAMAFNRRKLR